MAIFSEVARLGSFRAAAKSHGVSPSVVSRHISILESNLGEVLFNRSTRKLALTSVGEQFLVHCDRMLESANQGLTSVKENINQGHLRITLPITLVTTHFAELIKKFRDDRPQVDFSLRFNDDNLDIVEEGIDVALRLGPLLDSSLKSKRVATVSRAILATPEYLKSVGGVDSLHCLNRCTWIGRKNPAAVPILHSPSGEVYNIPQQEQFIQVNNVQAVKAFVLSHNGVGLFSNMLVERALSEGRLVPVLPEWQVQSMELYAVWPAQRTTGQLVKKFVDFLSDELDQL